MQAQEVRARTSHEIPDRPPIRIEVGQIVAAGERDDQWPEFVFVTGATGSGWVPARYLSGDSGPVVVHTAYETTELPVGVGQEVTVLERDDESGWWWCRTVTDEASAGDAAEGWVPASVFTDP